MNGIGIVLAKLLVDNPQFIPLYLIGLWFTIIKPIMGSSRIDDFSEEKYNEDITSDTINRKLVEDPT